ncbi:hypothetical protein K438DRAFT_1717737 [Mycena galopus ATCC 62051]|nr:hypothetical protein K438DRAFT_1717737 [Mycena galopus ATCC 62051]
MMTAACSECGAFVISDGNEFELNLTAAPRTLARYLELLDTNEPPQAPELALIRPVAENGAARLAALDAEISRLKDRLIQLEGERAMWSKHHAKNLTILSPLRRMPSEILGEILSWALPGPPFRSPLNIQDCPWVLTQVSSRWRAVALSRSSLWSMVYIDFRFGRLYPLEMVRTHMERAHTLKIHFYASEDVSSRPQIEMFELLSERSAAWEELSIQLTAALLPHVATLRSRLPTLQRAWVQWDTDASQTPDITSIDFFRMSNSLVDIGVFSEYRFVPTILPMHHRLTRYDFDAPWKAHQTLLKSLPNLHEVRIRLDFDQEPWPDSDEIIDLLHLRRLSVTAIECLDYLRAPLLDDLAIREASPDTCDHLEAFLIRSSSPIHRLCIDGLCDAASMCKLLQKYPSITEIAIARDGAEATVLKDFLCHFTVSDSIPGALMLPHISRIDIGCENSDVFDYPLYLNMVESRWNADRSALAFVELVLSGTQPDPDARTLARMDMLRNAGLGVLVSAGEEAEYRMSTWVHEPLWI